MMILEQIKEGICAWAADERDFWYGQGVKARGTDVEYWGETWIGYYAFLDGKGV